VRLPQQPAAFQIQAELRVPTKRLWSLAFSPDGKTLASGSGFWDSPSAVTIWDVASGKVRVKVGEEMPVRSVAFSPDGKLLATGEFDKTAKLRDAATGRVQITLQGHDHLVNSVAFSPDGRILASSDLGNTINLWEVSTGNLRITLQGHTDEVPKVAFSPDGRTLVSGSKDRTARLWDVATGRELRILQGHQDLVECVAFSPDGKLVATGSWDKTVKLWDAASGKEVRVFHGHTLPVLSLAFSPDGQVLATASGEWGDPSISADTPGPGEVKLWDLTTGKELATLRDHKDRIWAVTFSPDGKTLATGSWDGVIILWRTTAPLKQPKTTAPRKQPVPQDYEQRLRQLQDEIDRLKKEIQALRAKQRPQADIPQKRP
jgi:WD40 repeat protein